jgi:hypothetical protein
MKKAHGVLLGACLALPLAGVAMPGLAAQSGCGPRPTQRVTLRDWTAADQIQAGRLIADANAMFRRMDAEMNAMQSRMAALTSTPLPTPQQLAEASFGPGTVTVMGPGSATMLTMVSSGNGTCSETITESYPAHGGRPIVHVAQSGNACGTVHVGGQGPAPAAQPVAPRYRYVPQPLPNTPRQQLIQAEYMAPRG